MSAVTIKNRDSNAVILKSASGDSVQINPGAIRIVSDEFLIDYDTIKIRILSRNDAIEVTSSSEIIVPEITVANSNVDSISFAANTAKANLLTKNK